MGGITWGESDAFLDEHPDAYKDIDVVMQETRLTWWPWITRSDRSSTSRATDRTPDTTERRTTPRSSGMLGPGCPHHLAPLLAACSEHGNGLLRCEGMDPPECRCCCKWTFPSVLSGWTRRSETVEVGGEDPLAGRVPPGAVRSRLGEHRPERDDVARADIGLDRALMPATVEQVSPSSCTCTQECHTNTTPSPSTPTSPAEHTLTASGYFAASDGTTDELVPAWRTRGLSRRARSRSRRALRVLDAWDRLSVRCQRIACGVAAAVGELVVRWRSRRFDTKGKPCRART